MNFSRYTSLLVFAVVLVLTGCIESYTPPSTKNIPDILVVDGFLNASGEISVRLSKAMQLNDPGEPPAVENAVIFLEDSDNSSVQLNDISGGFHTASGLTIDTDKKYRIRINTAPDKEYLSEFIEITSSPDIDSVTWETRDDKVEVQITTHDNSKKSRYYLWTFDEDWEYSAYFASGIKWVDGEVLSRGLNDNITYCWKTQPSSSILVGSSVRLAEDVMYKFPVRSIPKFDQRISRVYSINVRQRVIDEKTFKYYEQLRKTTEELGGLFDPQPGQVLGNIYSSQNSSEPVLGIFNGGFVKEQRIFIRRTKLPLDFQRVIAEDCRMDTIPPSEIMNFDPANADLVGSVYNGPTLIGYTHSTKNCTDCRLKGGTTQKPAYWPIF